MNNKVKKIIAREGLIIIGIILAFLLMTSDFMSRGNAYISNAGYALLFLGYPVYLLIRFVIWVVKTIKEK